jgi:hypothetical protein
LEVGSVSGAAALGDAIFSDGTRTLSYDASVGTMLASGMAANVAGFNVTESIDGIMRAIQINNTSTGTSARANIQFFAGTNQGDITLFGSGHSGDTDAFAVRASSASSGGLILSTGTHAPISFRTNGSGLRWQIQGTDGDQHFVAGSDNTYDIGNSGAFRPRTIYIGTSLNVGPLASPSTASGDVVYGDATRTVTFDASAGTWLHSGSTAVVPWEVLQDQNAGFLARVRNANAGNAAFAELRVQGDTAVCSLTARSSTFTAAANECGVTVTNGPLVLVAASAQPVRIRTTAINRWLWDASGHYLCTTDNTLDVGASGATRPRTLYLGTSLNVGNGVTPSIANGDVVFSDGTRSVAWDASIGSLIIAGKSSANFAINVTATADINITALFSQNLSTGTSASTVLRLRNDAGNDVFLASYGTNHATNPNLAFLFTNNQELHVGTGNDFALIFETFNVNRFQIQNNSNGGHFVASTDNTYDIGNSGALRPRTIYLGTSVITPAVTGATTLAITSATTNALTLDSGTTGDIDIGTNANAKTITIGNVTGATAMVYNAGSGGHAFTGDIGINGQTPVARPAAYTLTVTQAPSRTLLASSGATATNNNNVISQLISDLIAFGVIQ